MSQNKLVLTLDPLRYIPDAGAHFLASQLNAAWESVARDGARVTSEVLGTAVRCPVTKTYQLSSNQTIDCEVLAFYLVRLSHSI